MEKKNWKRVPLGEVTIINPGRPRIERSDDAPTTFIPMQAVAENSGAIENSEIKPFREVKKGYTYFAENDVLFAKITPCMENGKHAIAQNLIDGIGFGSTEFHVIRAKERVIPEWIHFYLRQNSTLIEAANHFTGSVGQQRVPDTFLANLEIPLPPLSEQVAIAARLRAQLEQVARARAAAQEQLDAIDALPQSLLRQAFTS